MDNTFNLRLPDYIMKASDLSQNEKLLLADITGVAYNSEGGFCYKTNKMFADFLRVSKNTITNYIRDLKEKGYIDFYHDKGVCRAIYITTDVYAYDWFATIPAELINDEDLLPVDKMLYAEISSLTYKKGYCSMKNLTFSYKLKVSIRTIQNSLNKLSKKGYITIDIQRGCFRGGTMRKIYVNQMHIETSPEKVEVSQQASSPITTEVIRYHNTGAEGITTGFIPKEIHTEKQKESLERSASTSKITEELIHDIIRQHGYDGRFPFEDYYNCYFGLSAKHKVYDLNHFAIEKSFIFWSLQPKAYKQGKLLPDFTC